MEGIWEGIWFANIYVEIVFWVVWFSPFWLCFGVAEWLRFNDRRKNRRKRIQA